ncbi:hypothetical protein ERX37_02980 [Macrococcus hajekii]|uniref:Sporulation protein n=1 Tax=Macrococcus hajekii TaxID=198482 RepID=A0A4R6BMK0_9STAP|nr:sporulation protein [Macrococcus hajekii]TDM03064.1 hypothetical protein ERX37_02980 [Macrococcus hajekii]GGB06261.1 hypothetical protein GCM10007190_12890 [Macrococcus hajekii]
MFKNLLSSIGFDDVAVDTRINQQTYHPDDTIEGLIELKGNVNHIEYIEVQLIERTENQDDTSDFSTFDTVLNKVHLTPETGQDIHFQLDEKRDIQSIDNQFFIMTHVSISNSIDAYDEDEIFFSQS